ncbi:hypothetical protein JIN85_10630 [Luteolibacter pohnpeiensis]|uniref:Uncharacterized protein n=1 Tax=Luteolibacter pohnpeiensis TaxID=454153 RepID=A0A934SCR4_9BACT|nr:hypothetical protein [Luteolibacter pohnpeiensis]MBK1882873.1 hypothetical protein [Luteolibacter pohnpeiensis]
MTEDPYAVAPSILESEPETAPQSRGWTVHGKRLLVSAGAVLPMVDPFSGETPERMTLFLLRVQKRPRGLRHLLIAGLVALVVALLELLPEDYNRMVWLFGVLSIVAQIIIGSFYKSIMMRVFVSESTLIRMRVARILNLTFVLALIALMGTNASGKLRLLPVDYQHWLLPLVFMIRLVAVLLMREILFAGRTAGGLMRITGVHPKALLEMEKLLPDERKMPPQKHD